MPFQHCLRLLIVALCLVGTTSCRPVSKSEEQDASSNEPIIPISDDGSDGLTPTRMITAEEMRKELGANEQAQFERSGTEFVAAGLARSGATTLQPLAGQPLKLLDISQTQISDLSPLKGMPLEKLLLIKTPVSDLSPLMGMPLVMLDASGTSVSDLKPLSSLVHLEELYLEDAKVADVTPLRDLNLSKLWLNLCPVKDLKPLAGKNFVELNLCETLIEDFQPLSSMSLGTLWLRETALKDLSPIQSLSLVSLDIQGTPVKDLSPLQGMSSLERLNIAQTEVTDLTPLAKLNLSRLIFTPEKIEKGLDVIRNMKSLRQLDTSFEGIEPAATPSEFWERYDRTNSGKKSQK